MTLVQFFRGKGEEDIRDLKEFYRERKAVEFIIETLVEIIEAGVLRALAKAFGKEK